jgi:haloalkane dehalogenase
MHASEFHATRRFAETPFGRIAYIERGSGDPALFVHGVPLNGFHWRGVIHHLAEHRRCIAPDLMGLGYSEVPETQDLEPAHASIAGRVGRHLSCGLPRRFSC